MPKTKQEVLDLLAEHRQLYERIKRAEAQLIADNRAEQSKADSAIQALHTAHNGVVGPMKTRMAAIEQDLRDNA